MIAIYSNKITNRLLYILEFIFKDVLSEKYTITNKIHEFKSINAIKINYSKQYLDACFNIYTHNLLFEDNIIKQNIEKKIWNDLPIFFVAKNKSDLEFDIFAASFYLISRYEEYLPFKPDRYGRFESTQSIAHKYNFLQINIIEQWIYYFIKLIYKKFNINKKVTFNYCFTPTYDVDIAWAYLNRKPIRNIAALSKSIFQLNFKGIIKRYKVITKTEKDPYFTFDQLDKLHQNNANVKPVFFFQIGKYGKHDKNISYKNQNFKNLIYNRSVKYNVGLHPSFASNTNIRFLKNEKQNLENIINKEITKSRQHYLILKFPETYEKLLKVGIKNDYSLGYADNIGFRAGTSHPFFFFNLKKNKKENLRIYSFQIMDVTLYQYMKLNSKESFLKLKKNRHLIQKFGGNEITLWHNDTFGKKTTIEYGKLYKEFIQNI